MIYIYSGEDNVTSRNIYLQHVEKLKAEGLEVVNINGKEVKEENLEIFLGGRSLFGQTRALTIENLFSLTKSKDKENLINKIIGFKDQIIIFWEEKDFSKADVLKYPDFSIKNFKLPPSLFSFLDKLYPKRITENLQNFHLAVLNSDAGYIFSMLIRQIRLLILAKDDELTTMAPWQRAKLYKQAEVFDMNKLKAIYLKLLEIDFQQKSSGTPFSLQGQIELLLAEI